MCRFSRKRELIMNWIRFIADKCPIKASKVMLPSFIESKLHYR